MCACNKQKKEMADKKSFVQTKTSDFSMCMHIHYHMYQHLLSFFLPNVGCPVGIGGKGHAFFGHHTPLTRAPLIIAPSALQTDLVCCSLLHLLSHWAQQQGFKPSVTDAQEVGTSLMILCTDAS